MKSSFNRKKPEPEIEQDEEDVEIEESGPKIAAGKKGKLAIILASSILVTGVIYVMFFKSEPPKKEKLEEVSILPNAKVSVAPSEDTKSPFEIDKPVEKEKDSNAEIFDKPATPEIPTLPELPKDAVADAGTPIIPTLPTPGPAAATPTEVVTPATANPTATTTPVAAQNPVAQQPLVQQPAKEQAKDDDYGVDPRYAPIVVLSGGSGPASSVGYEKNIVGLGNDPISKLDKSQSNIATSYIEDRLHTIAQGKLFTAVLETAINTEIPGFVRAVISRDIYGESGNKVLIPRGSRLFGTYSSQITRGQGRVDISWTRLIRPDGVALAISFNASDQFGRSGLSGEVDNRYGSVIANSLLTSVLAVGTAIAAEKLSGGNSTATTTTNPAQGTVTTSNKASNQVIYDVTKTIIDTISQVASNTLNTAPVIRVPQGTRITVVVNSDITVPDMK